MDEFLIAQLQDTIKDELPKSQVINSMVNARREKRDWQRSEKHKYGKFTMTVD